MALSGEIALRTGKLAITGIAAAALVLTTPSTAWGAPKAQPAGTKVLTTAVAGPFNLAVDRHRLLVADGFTSKLSRIKADGTLKTIVNGPQPGNVAGVAISRNGRSIAYTTTENPSDFVNANGSLHIRRAGGGTISVNLAAYETKKNPDKNVSYGVKTTPECAAAIEAATGQPASYKGIDDSHPYSVTAYGKRSWIVADAGGNDLVKVNRHGRVSTVAVLPVQPLVLTAEVLAAFEPSSRTAPRASPTTSKPSPLTWRSGATDISTYRRSPVVQRARHSGPAAACTGSTRATAM